MQSHNTMVPSSRRSTEIPSKEVFRATVSALALTAVMEIALIILGVLLTP